MTRTERASPGSLSVRDIGCEAEEMKMLKSEKNTLLALMVALSLVGCATNVKRDNLNYSQQGSDARATVSIKANPVKTVSVQFSRPVEAMLTPSYKMSTSRFEDIVVAKLTESNLYSRADSSSGTSIRVEVTELYLRSTMSAVMLGILAGSDTIKGTVSVIGPKGEALDRFEVSGSYGLGGFAGGIDDTRIGWLVESFASELTIQVQKLQ